MSQKAYDTGSGVIKALDEVTLSIANGEVVVYGNLAVVVITEKDGAPQVVLTRLAGRERRGLVLVLDRGYLTETSGIYGPSDANCCPSQLVKTYFRWDGNSLVVDHTDTIAIPQGKQVN